MSNIKVVLDWFYEINKFFYIVDFPEEEQVKIVAYKLCGGVEAWWQNEPNNHRRQDKDHINTWQRMKRMIFTPGY